MALPPAGVTLIADGSAAFNAALDQAATSLRSLETAGNSVARAMSAFDSVLAPVSRLFDQLASRELRLLEMAFLRFINNMVVASFQGTAFADTLADMTTRLEGVVKYNLAPFWDQFNTLLTKAGPGIEAFVNFASKTFADLGVDALTWGQNIVSQLAQGMLDAAGQVLDALISIGNMIAGFLMPGSPPKLLPDLDQWGTAAASVYLQAWTKADFSAFGEMSKEIEANLRSLSPTGKEKDLNLIPTILGTREAIAQAVEQARETGTVTAESLDKVYQAAGAVTPVMKDYLQSAFNLELANKNLAAAQDSLNKVTEHYDDLLKPIDASLRQLDDAQKNLSDQQQLYALNLILNDPNATAGEKAQARLQIDKIGLEERKRGLEEEKTKAVDTANAKVEAAAQARSVAQAQYDTQKGLIDLMTAQNKLLREQEALLDSLEKKAKAGPKGRGGKQGIAAVAPAFNLGDFIPDSLKKKWEEFLATFKKVWDAVLAVMQPAIDAWNNKVMPAWNNLVKAFQDSVPHIEAFIADMVAFTVREMGTALPAVFNNLATSLNALADIWQHHSDTIMLTVDIAFRFIVATITGAFTLLSGIVAFQLAGLSGAFEVWSLVFQGKWQAAGDRLVQMWGQFFDIITGTLSAFFQLALNIVGVKLADFVAQWQTNLDMLHFIILTAFTTMGEIIIIVIGATYLFLQGALENIHKLFQALATNLITATDPAAHAIDSILTAAMGLFTWLQSHIFNFKIHLPDLPKWAIPGSPTPFEMGLRGIYDALQDVNGIAAPALGGLAQMVYPPASAGQMANSSYSNSSVNNWNYAPVYNAPAPSPQHDFAMMEVWAR